MPEHEGNGQPVVEDREIEQAMAFARFAQESGVDLGELDVADEPEAEKGPPEPIPGASDDEIDLTPEQKSELARRLTERIETYFSSAMSERRGREEEIRRSFNLLPERSTAGLGGETEMVVSGLMRRLTLQAAARLQSGILDSDKIAKVRPIFGQPIVGEEDRTDLAIEAENFLTNMLRYGVRISRRLAVSLEETSLVGTSVIRCGWRRKPRTKHFYDTSGKLQTREIVDQGLDWKLIPNERVIVWPPTTTDWQEDTEMVGHEATYSHSAWHAKATELGLSEQEAHEVYKLPGETDETMRERMAEQGIDLDSMNLEQDPVTISELWCDMPLPGSMGPKKFVVILHKDSQTILRINWNTHHEGWHPYFPLRYRVVPHSAWGDGVGQDIIYKQSQASALETLQIDNLAAGAYWVNQVVAGSFADQSVDKIHPGQNVYVSEIDKDFKPTKMGGDAPEVLIAKGQNEMDASLLAGIPDVLQGIADRTMKSGSTTGATMALIEQASVRFNSVGRTIKDDLADLLSFSLQQVAQYAPDGVYYKFAPKGAAEAVQMIRYTPPRDASITEIFHIEVEAPSMAASNEARRERYLMVWTFAMQYLDWLQQTAVPLLQEENPAAIPRLVHQAIAFAHAVSKRVIQYSDLPGLPEQLPSVPEPEPADEQINNLMQQLNEAFSMVQQLQQQNQALEESIQLGLHHEHQQGGGMPS